jgi:hypothetical protein
MNKTVNDIVREVVEGEGEGEGESATKYMCGSCGWEITNPNWWDIAKDYTGQYLCDDCEITLTINRGGEE